MTALPSGFLSFRRFAAPAASRIRCELRSDRKRSAKPFTPNLLMDAAHRRCRGRSRGYARGLQQALNRLSRRELAIAAGSES